MLYPQLLHRLGYIGALHAALGEGKYPEGSQVKIRWQGPDHSAIDTIGRVPLDAARPETFLALASKLGETMDMDHVATVCLAHWPGQVSPWYHDLRRIARYGAMLGKFVTVDQYFRDTDYPGTSERFKTDQYQSPYLPQAVSRQQQDPISTSVRYWRRHATLRAAQTLDTLVALIRNVPQETVPALWEASRRLRDDSRGWSVGRTGSTQCLADRLREAAELVGQRRGSPEPGYLLWNPSTAVRRMGVDLPQLRGLPAVTKPIYAAASEGEHHYVVADVPGDGIRLDPRLRGRPAERAAAIARGRASVLQRVLRSPHQSDDRHAAGDRTSTNSAAIACRSNWLSGYLPRRGGAAGSGGHLFGHGGRYREGHRRHERDG